MASQENIPLLKGESMQNIPCIENAFMLIEQGKIKSLGPMTECPDPKSFHQVQDLQDHVIIPSFVDAHTHLVFAATREEEFVDRIKGLSYQEIAAKGGGILNSAAKLSQMSEENLYELSANKLHELASLGTGAIEMKSGYGLSLESELKILRIHKKLAQHYPGAIRSTFLGAHAIPLQYRDRREDYIRIITDEMLPVIAQEKLADYCDVFCEKGFFSLEETDLILSKASQYGLKPRIHSNQFTHCGGIELALRHKALSVDHLEVLNETEIQTLAQSNTIPILLPIAAFFMNQHQGPAKQLIDNQCGIALATDFNPGTAHSGSMPFLFSLACIAMRLTPEQVLAATTINAAFSLELEDQYGSLCPGKWASFIILQAHRDLAFIPYSMSDSWIQKIYYQGKVYDRTQKK